MCLLPPPIWMLQEERETLVLKHSTSASCIPVTNNLTLYTITVIASLSLINNPTWQRQLKSCRSRSTDIETPPFFSPLFFPLVSLSEKKINGDFCTLDRLFSSSCCIYWAYRPIWFHLTSPLSTYKQRVSFGWDRYITSTWLEKRGA